MSEQKAPLEEVSQLVEEHGDVLYRYARWRVNSHEVAEEFPS
jgi:DNA-directed RNA polymerase specialized sigma24 family protein